MGKLCRPARVILALEAVEALVLAARLLPMESWLLTLGAGLRVGKGFGSPGAPRVAAHSALADGPERW